MFFTIGSTTQSSTPSTTPSTSPSTTSSTTPPSSSSTDTPTTTGSQSDGPYVPGTPGAAWEEDEILVVKAKLWRMFTYNGGREMVKELFPNFQFSYNFVYSKCGTDGGTACDMPDAAKVFRFINEMQ